jgi:hypothetical protein
MNGVARDSRKVKLGNGTPVEASDRDRFEEERDRLLVLLHPATPSVPALAGQTAESPTRWLP